MCSSTEHGFTDAANTEVRVFVRRYMFLNSVVLGTLQLIVISSRYERHSEEKGEVLYRQKVLSTEISKKAWLFAKLQPGRARKRINAT